MTPADALALAGTAAEIIQAVRASDPLTAAEKALDVAYELIPVEQLSAFLDGAAVRRAKTIKDIADAAKFGPLGG